MATRSRALRQRALAPPVEPIYEEVGDLIRAHREANGKTVEDMAASAAVSRQRYTDWEAGRARIPLHRLAHIAEVLGLNLLDVVPLGSAVEAIRYSLTATGADLAAMRRVINGQAAPA